ncbi:MAG: type II secretion system F family protein [Planctomycetes bacterium]|nr:type II secretion system F family protein [Planctomycetota bacterium]
MTHEPPNSDPFPAMTASLGDRNPFVFRLSRFGAWVSLSRRQNSLLELLEIIHRERLEPAPWIAHYALEERGWYRRRLRRFSDRVAKGTPWLEALEQTPDVLSDDQVLALRLASQSGTLGPTFASLRTRATSNESGSDSHWTSMMVYWSVVGAILIGVLFFFEYRILPNLRQIYHHLELGPSANSLMRADPMKSAIAIGVAAVVLLVAGILLGWSVSIRRWIRKQWMGKWFSPPLATISAPVLQMLSTNVREGRPIVGALSTLAKYHSDSRVQQGLLLARNEIEQGATEWESMQTSGLISSLEQQALESCQGKDSQAWILEQLASKRELDYRRRQSLFEKCVHPVIVLFFGGLVFWLASSTLVSIYGLVTALAP